MIHSPSVHTYTTDLFSVWTKTQYLLNQVLHGLDIVLPGTCISVDNQISVRASKLLNLTCPVWKLKC